MTGDTPLDDGRSSQFRKGQSGNPRGRPRKTVQTPASAFQVVFDYMLPFRRGTQKAIPAEEAMLHKLLQQAMAGERLAQRKVLQMIARHDAQRAAPIKSTPTPEMVVLHWPQDVDESALVLGIARIDPRPPRRGANAGSLLLEPWAVQLGLERAGPIDEGKLARIKGRTWQPDTVHLPCVSVRAERE